MSCLLEILFPDCNITNLYETANTIIVEAHSKKITDSCPDCKQPSKRIHSYYWRKPHDLPLSQYHVRIKLNARRFRCKNQDCSRQTFSERWSSWLMPNAQRTTRNKNALYHIGQVAGGAGGARLLAQLKMQASGSTLLRIIRAWPIKRIDKIQVVGVDDWAIRKGRTYGTILVDLEQSRVIELLPDRSSETLANWLAKHPGVKIVARDRSSEYAKGIKAGAPRAKQVADRWHLLLNMYQMLERYFRQNYGRLRQLPALKSNRARLNAEKRGTFIRTEREMIESQRSRARRVKLFLDIQKRKRSGETILGISKALKLHRETVRTFYYAEHYPERSQHSPRKSILDEYVPHLHKRWSEGCEDARALWREIQKLGYTGSYGLVSQWMRVRRRKPSPNTTSKALISSQWIKKDNSRRNTFPAARKIAWLFSKFQNDLDPWEQDFVTHLQQDAEIKRLYPLVQIYQSMIRNQDAARLDRWLSDCLDSKIPRLKTFSEGIKRDYLAVKNALELPWSSGPAEGHINRLKLIKRQMFGRAKLDLLERRILYLGSEHESC